MNIRHGARALAALAFFFALPLLAQPQPAQIELTTVAMGMSGALGVTHAGDGSNRLFVTQQGGSLRVVRSGSLATTPYLTINSTTTTCRETVGGPSFLTGFVNGGEQGLLGATFHPDFESNGHLYVSFSDANGDSVVARFTSASPAADVLTAEDLATCLIVLRIDQDFTNHNGGNILFGPDTYLYFGLGDGGNGNDPCDRGQTLNPGALVNTVSCTSDSAFTNPAGQPARSDETRALLGKMLRIDVDGTTADGTNQLCGSRLGGGANYAIPADNPFAGADAQSGCDEVFIYGLRNPWRWSFDRSNGDLFIGDVGQSAWEEVSFFAAPSAGLGANADWRICEGRQLRGSCTTACTSDASEVILEYQNGTECGISGTEISGISITGGFRYRGPDPVLQGVYFFGDAGSSSLYYSALVGGTWTEPSTSNRVLSAIGGSILGFGESEAGELYMVGGGQLRRIGIAAPTDLIFANSFE